MLTSGSEAPFRCAACRVRSELNKQIALVACPHFSRRQMRTSPSHPTRLDVTLETDVVCCLPGADDLQNHNRQKKSTSNGRTDRKPVGSHRGLPCGCLK